MIQNISLRTLLFSLIATLAVMLLATTAYQSLNALKQRETARKIEDANYTADLLLMAAGKWAAERGRTAMMLRTPDLASTDDQALIARLRNDGDFAFERAIARLHEFTDREIYVSVLNSRSHVLQLRERVDTELKKNAAERQPEAATDFVAALTMLIERSQELRLVAQVGINTVESKIADLLWVKHHVWLMSEYAGRERAHIGSAVASGEFMGASLLRQLDDYRNNIVTAWAIIDAYALKDGAIIEVQNAVQEVRDAFFGNYDELRQLMLVAQRDQGSFPVSSVDWFAASTNAINQILQLGEVVGDATARLARLEAGAATKTFITEVSLLVIGFFLVGISIWVASVRIAGPLGKLTHAISKMTAGPIDLPMPETERKDEIGTLAVALEEYRIHSLHDALTGLPNRRYLDHFLMPGGLGGGSPRPVSLLQIDLDRLHQVIDTLGHSAGDALLVRVAKLLRDCTSEEDFVARTGVGEFMIVCSRSTTEAIRGIADRIISEICRPVLHKGKECRIGVSVGSSMIHSSDVQMDLLAGEANSALHQAKRTGGNKIEFFSQSMRVASASRKTLGDELLSGIDNGQFEAFYQPQFDARTLDIAGIEALARWNHPTRGILAPGEFMSIAEELNVISSIDRIVASQARDDFDKLRRLNAPVPRVSINVSLQRLCDESFCEDIRKQVEASQLSLSIEILESAFIDNIDQQVIANINKLKSYGVDIEIDDFGTGHASIMGLIKALPQKLKIAGDIIFPIVNSKAQRRLVSAIIEIGRSLDISIVAEGVETKDHISILQDLGCDYLQGYAFARPMPVDSLVKFLRQRNWYSLDTTSKCEGGIGGKGEIQAVRISATTRSSRWASNSLQGSEPGSTPLFGLPSR